MFLCQQACLLKRSDSGESHVLLLFFVRDHGLLRVLSRKRTRGPAGPALPDLFEIGEATIEQRGGDKPAWLKEWLPVHQFPGIARQYRSLQAAARLARFYEANLVHMESFGEAWRLMETAMQSLSTGPHAEAVLLKVLYALARAEGYPVREQWLAQCTADSREAIREVLTRPLGQSPSEPAQITAWTRDLERFLQGETDLIVPES